jgi:hypothetical protein
VEVVEHLDPPRLAALERVVFEFARPGTVVATTPNRDYNVVWPSLPAGKFRHSDHRHAEGEPRPSATGADKGGRKLRTSRAARRRFAFYRFPVGRPADLDEFRHDPDRRQWSR